MFRRFATVRSWGAVQQRALAQKRGLVTRATMFNQIPQEFNPTSFVCRSILFLYDSRSNLTPESKGASTKRWRSTGILSLGVSRHPLGAHTRGHLRCQHGRRSSAPEVLCVRWLFVGADTQGGRNMVLSCRNLVYYSNTWY